MSKLEELIQELCPDGVEYKPLKEISLMQRGTAITKKQITYGNIPVISGGRMPAYSCNQYNRTGETITVAGSGAGAGYVNYWNEPIFVADAFSITGAENYTLTRYLYHYLTNIQDKIYATQTGGGVPHVHISSIENITIPIPPIEVQQEIVRILDSFTELTKELTTELTTELTVRKQQYEYYRDELLKFDYLNSVSWVRLKDIATDIFRGTGIKREEVTSNGIPCVRYGEIYTTYNIWFNKCVSHTQLEHIPNPKWFDYGDILFAITGENIEDIAKSIAYIGHEKCLAGGDIVVMKHNQNPKYLAYALSTMDAQRQKGKGKVKSKVVHSSVPAIEKIEIPLPPLDIQERIVNVLDQFYFLCNNLSDGLPAEIEARQKQYEYYRDKLLTFKEKMA